MNSEDDIVCVTSNRNRDAVTPLIIPSIPSDRGNEGSELRCDEANRQSEEVNRNLNLKQQISAYIAALHDWWICTNVIKKVKLLGFVFLPCLAIGLYIFHYTQHPGTLHNPISVLHPLSVVHPLIPTPFQSAVKFIEEKGKDLLLKSADVSVTTTKGPIIGRRVDPNAVTGASYDAFLGIPYGHVPARFQRAVPVSSWLFPRPTQRDGPPCPQPGVDFSEDCLFVNVFTPKSAVDSSSSYPVIVFIHGSDFTYGSSSSEHYGPDFLVPKGVILVTFNYRLGANGFLTLGSRVAPGNMGLYDTQLALRWVQDEIRSFAGDPGRVTLMGQGAGSVLAMYNYLSPASAGLFRYVIAQSGSALADWGHYSASEGATRARSLAAAVGCGSSANDTQLLTCLRKTNLTYLVENQAVPLPTRYEATGQTMVFLPVLDTDFADKPFFTDSLGNLLDSAANRSKPLILGFTADEGIVKFAEDACWKSVEENLDAFIPSSVGSWLGKSRKAAMVRRIRSRYFRDSVTDSKVLDIVRILQDHMMMNPVLQVARRLANSSYGYVFDFVGPWTPDPAYITKFHVSGVNHGFDLRYLFYSADAPQDLGNCSSLRDSLAVRDAMVNWWTNFVKTGAPGSDWPKISKGGYLKIATNATLIDASTVENDHNYGFWASLETTADISSAVSAKLNFLVIFAALCILVTTSL